MSKLKAFRIREADKKVSSAFEEIDVADLDTGEVLIRVAFASINYNDAPAATGAGRIIRPFPCMGGIDLSGTVVESSDPRFKSGDSVIATSYDIGVAHDGGYAEFARIPAEWVVPMPSGMDAFQAMALGTAGYTAALGIQRMELNGLKPENGPVIVSGATGGVGSLAVDMLASRGYRVTALTGKPSEEAYLKGLGATEVLDQKSLDLGKIRPLEKPLWAGAVDNLGGDILSWMASSMQPSGTIASIGLAASMDLKTTVAPFILRGVCLLGIDSGYTPMPLRAEVWKRLASDLRPRHLAAMTKTVEFADLPGAFAAFMEGQVRGRTVVRISG